MAVFKKWQGSRYVMQLMVINLVGCLAWLSGIAFAQVGFSEAATGSVSFPDLAIIACIGNVAVFVTSLLRKRLDLEIGARDVLATHRGPKLKKIKEFGLTTCDVDVDIEAEEDARKYEDAVVVMLSQHPFNSSITQFMKYIHHCHGLDSILLKSLPLECEIVTAELCRDLDLRQRHQCSCTLIWTEDEEITMMVARRMPGTLKRLSDSLCLLPSWKCLRRGCHGCNQGLLHVKQTELQRRPGWMLTEEDSEEESPAELFREFEMHVEDTEAEPEAEQRLKERSRAESPCEIHVDVEETRQLRLTEEGSKAESPAAVCELLERFFWRNRRGYIRIPPRGCICIPLREAGDDDEWTKLLIRFMGSKDKVAREVRVMASVAMEKYIHRSGESSRIIEEIYTGFSLIVQRLIEVIVNIALTGWLRVDGLSSSLIARRVVRDHLVDSTGTGFNANSYLTSAEIKCNQSTACQLLRFRGNLLGVRTLSYIVGCVNLICSNIWGLLIASEGSFGLGKWYGIHCMPPSRPRVFAILIGIGVALVMDSLGLLFLCSMHIIKEIESILNEIAIMTRWKKRQIKREKQTQITGKVFMILGGIVLEIVYIVLGILLIVKGMYIQHNSGRWIYSVIQGLIWVKWGIGSYILGDHDESHPLKNVKIGSWLTIDCICSNGVMMYSTTFMLNAILAGVIAKWKYFPF